MTATADLRAPAARCFAPGALLAPFIEAIELPLDTGTQGVSAGYTVLPSPQPVLGLQLRGHLALVGGAEPRLLDAFGFTGLQTAARTFLPEAGTRTLIVRFKPYGAAGLLGPQFADLVDLSLGAAELLPASSFAQIEERLASAQAEPEVVTALLGALAAMIGRGGATVPAAVRAAADAIVQAHGDVTIAVLASELGVSVRRLERGFHGSIGLAPKQMAGVARFAWAAQQLHGSASATRIAQDAGFADQAQMSREFARRLGVAPSMWRLAR